MNATQPLETVTKVVVSEPVPEPKEIEAPPAFSGSAWTQDSPAVTKAVSIEPPLAATVLPSPVEPEVTLPSFGKPPKSRRKVMLFGAAAVIAALGILTVALPAPKPSGAPRVRLASSAAAANQPVVEAVLPVVEPAPQAATAEPAVAPSAESAAVTDADEVRITINIQPDESLFCYKGKVLGRTPFILKHPRGEKRTYEVRKVGHKTRRVVITGADKAISFALQQEIPHPDFL